MTLMLPESPQTPAGASLAAPTAGNSGGALVDASGRIVGMTTAAASLSSSSSGSIGVGFAIPIAKALAVSKTLTTGL